MNTKNNAMGESKAHTDLPGESMDIVSAEEWLKIGTACGWSIVPLFQLDGTAGFGIFFSETFEKAKSQVDAREMSESFVRGPQCAALFRKLKIKDLIFLPIHLQRAAFRTPLPCATVLKKQLLPHWDANSQSYIKSKIFERVLLSASKKEYEPFLVLTCWSEYPARVVSFLSGLKALDPDCLTKKGLMNFDRFQELWGALSASSKDEKRELISAEELMNVFGTARCYPPKEQPKVSSQKERVVREADDKFALEISEVFGVTEKKPGRSSATQSDYYTLPILAEEDFYRFVLYFGKMFKGVINGIFERSHLRYSVTPKASSIDRFRFGVDFVLGVANHFLKPAQESGAAELEAALQNRKRKSSWSSLSQIYSKNTSVPLVPSIVCDDQFSTPGILRPEIAVLKKPEQIKKLAQIQNPYITCEDFVQGKVSFDFWESPAGRALPLVAEQVLGGLLHLVRSMPGIYQNLGFLTHGKALSLHLHKTSSEGDSEASATLETMLHRFDQGSRFLSYSNDFSVSFTSILDLPSGMGEIGGIDYDLHKFPNSPKDLNLVRVVESKPIQLNLQFRPKNDGGLEKIFDAILKVFSASSEAIRAEIRENRNEKSLLNLDEIEYVPIFTFEADGKIFTETEWLSAKKTKTGYILGDGHILQKESYEKCLEVFHHRQRALVRFGALKVHNLWRASRLSNTVLDQKLTPEDYLGYVQTQLKGLGDEADAEFVKGFSEQLELLDSFPNGPQSIPLRPYQKFGVGWILSRFALGLGCCLADEMGLGKTAQALHVLKCLHLKKLPFLADNFSPQYTGTTKPRSLVVCPKSLGLNWLREFSIWAPALKVQLIEGQAIASDTDVVVTTYARLRLRAEEWAATEWLCVVLDEAHNIKNQATSQARSARSMRSKFRLALTGTPLENHPRELWSLLDWLNEGWLGDVTSFEFYTRLARSNAEKNLMLAPLRSMIGPVLLRRLKSSPNVALSLPEKMERIIDIELSEEQSALYEAVIITALGAQSARESESFFEISSRYLKAILHTKQICNHPDNFLEGDEDSLILENKGDFPTELRKKILKEKTLSSQRRGATGIQKSLSVNSLDKKVRSSKLEALLELLLQLKDSESGILIFTQFKKSAAIICSAIEEMAYENGIHKWTDVPYLGSALSASEREALVAEFQADSEQDRVPHSSAGREAPPILVLSLKTGGIGLNLTGASQVIHFDRWWNPAVEAQASDRAHRIGQKRTVTVTHFRAFGTIEEGIARLMESKKSLAHDFLEEASMEGVQESLRDEVGFLKLVDPRGVFSMGRLERLRKNQVTQSVKSADSEVCL